MTKYCETQRLILRILDASWAESVADYYIRNKEFLAEWEPARGKEFYTAEFQRKQLSYDLALIESGSLYRLWLFTKESPEKVIGNFCFNNIIRGAFLSCHLGYKLDKDEVGKGYMTEALQKGIDIIFNEAGLHRIEANIMPKNTRSLRVVEKLGFYNEGIAYRYLKINGRWEDHIHMVLLNDKV